MLRLRISQRPQNAENSAVTTSPLSDAISKDLKKRGMTFVDSTIIYAYLQAIGVINANSDDGRRHGNE